MARNRRPVSKAPQYESSSEEEEEDLGSEEEETQHQPQLNNTASTPKKPQPTPTSYAPNKLQPTPDTSDSDSEDDPDSDSPPTAPRRADPNIKPTASKPMADPPKPTKKFRPDPTPPTPPPKSAATAGKRPAAESNEALDSKRAKKKKQQKEKAVAADINHEATPKMARLQRLWSEDDEIAILKGMIEFRAKKGYDPMSDLNTFIAFIKKSLRLGDVSETQFSTRLRRIRKKFKDNLKKGKDVFNKRYERHTYALSKKIWGEESDGFDVGNAEKDSNGKGRKNGKGLSGADEEEGERVEEGANAGAKCAIGLDFSFEEVGMRDGLKLVSGSKKLEMMDKWRQFRDKEVELYLMRLDLAREQANQVLEVLKK